MNWQLPFVWRREHEVRKLELDVTEDHLENEIARNLSLLKSLARETRRCSELERQLEEMTTDRDHYREKYRKYILSIQEADALAGGF